MSEGEELRARIEGRWPEIPDGPLERLMARVRAMTACTLAGDQAAVLAALERLRAPGPKLGDWVAAWPDEGLTEAVAGQVARLGDMRPAARRWAERVAGVVHERPEVTSNYVLTMMGETLNRPNTVRVGCTMRALGWRRQRVGSGGGRSYRYLPPVL